MNCLVKIILLFVCVSQLTTACPPNRICRKERDRIVQASSTVTASDRRSSGLSNAWYINPNTGSFNTILAFKNFSSPFANVVVVGYHRTKQPTTQTFRGHLGNFEVVIPDTFAVLVHVPVIPGTPINFVLDYNTGCALLKKDHGEVHQFANSLTREQATSCWLIHPKDSEERKRIYLNLHNVNLAEGQQINIWDLHTANIIAQTDGERSRMVAAESKEDRYQQSIMIDFNCTTPDCDVGSSTFSIAYYTMTQADSDCIERKKRCDRNATDGTCDFECTALNRMIQQEYNLQAKEFGEKKLTEDYAKQPIVRSGNGRRSKCILPPKYCGCPKVVPKILFCNPYLNCMKMKNCTFACIYHRMTSCTRVKFLRSTPLL